MVRATRSVSSTRGENEFNGKRQRHEQQLLPGLPDDLTVANISTKLSWPVLNNLTVVSTGWLQAMQSRKIFEARRCCEAEQIAFVFPVNGTRHAKMNESDFLRFALYSVGDSSAHYLPQIPNVSPNTIIDSYTYTPLSGKLYFMASVSEESSFSSTSTIWRRFTYVYDLAGHIGWKECAYPECVSHLLESAVMDGKIFVCGLAHGNTEIHACAKYDCDNDHWSPVTTINVNSPKDLAVKGMHEELVFVGSRSAGVHVLGPCYCRQVVGWLMHWIHLLLQPPLEFYYFRSTESSESDGGIPIMIFNGNFMKINEQGVHVYDSTTSTWVPWNVKTPKSNAIYLQQRQYIEIPAAERGMDVKVVQNTIFYLEGLSDNHNTFRLHLRSREAIVRGNHLKVPVNVKYNHGLLKSVTWTMGGKFNYMRKGLLKCPVLV